MEPRVVRTYNPYQMPSVQGYVGRCNAPLDAPLPVDANEQPVLTLSADARKVLGAAFERFERAGRLGALRSIKPFAMRAAEQAARVAGVLTAFADELVVGLATMRGALEIVGHSLDTWQSLIDVGAVDETSANALRLYEWLVDRDGMAWPISAITNGGPPCVRSKDRRDAALDLLVQRGLVETLSGKTASVVRGVE